MSILVHDGACPYQIRQIAPNQDDEMILILCSPSLITMVNCLGCFMFDSPCLKAAPEGSPPPREDEVQDESSALGTIITVVRSRAGNVNLHNSKGSTRYKGLCQDSDS